MATADAKKAGVSLETLLECRLFLHHAQVAELVDALVSGTSG